MTFKSYLVNSLILIKPINAGKIYLKVINTPKNSGLTLPYELLKIKSNKASRVPIPAKERGNNPNIITIPIDKKPSNDNKFILSDSAKRDI